MGKVYYEERQSFGRWVYALAGMMAAGVVFDLAVSVMLSEAESLLAGQNIAMVLLLVGVFLSVNVLYMITRVTDTEIFVQFGRAFPLFRARIPLREITDFRSVQYRPLRDAGGWGIRGGRFEGARCRFYNVSGDRAVFVETPKRRYIIGSQTSDRFAVALEDALKGVKSENV